MTRFAVLLLGAVMALHAQFNLRRAPGFSLPDTTMKQHDLQDYRGKVVLIDFMKTDCPSCQQLTKTLEQVKAKYGDKIQILSVVNPPDNMSTVAKYAATHKSSSPFLFDCGQMAAAYLQVTPKNPTVHLPQVIVVDKAGMIRRELKDSALDLTSILGAIEAALR